MTRAGGEGHRAVVMATEKRAKPVDEPPTDWTVEKLIGLGALTLITFLSFIYFVSP